MAEFSKAINQLAPQVDQVWVALALQLARQATPDDCQRLETWARTAEHPDPQMARGLRFLVRGDVLLADGSFITLDELAAEVGLPSLPYLEDLPPEL